MTLCANLKEHATQIIMRKEKCCLSQRKRKRNKNYVTNAKKECDEEFNEDKNYYNVQDHSGKYRWLVMAPVI